MTDSKDEKKDLTRIEDLSEFIHNEEEEEDFELPSLDDLIDEDIPEVPVVEEREDFSADRTDPNFELPDEFSASETSDSFDFNNYENDEVKEEPPQENGDFSSGFENENSYNHKTSTDLTSFNDEFDSSFNTPIVEEEKEEQSNNFQEDFNTGTDIDIEQESFSSESISQEFDEDFETDLSEDQTQKDDLFQELDYQEEAEITEATSSNLPPDLPELDVSIEISEEPINRSDGIIGYTDEISQKVETPKKHQPHNKPEDFKQLKEFASNVNYTNMAQEGNPPYSIIIKDLSFHEDAKEILDILLELGIVKEDGKEEAAASLNRGAMLIPRISEYSAIILIHKLRGFEANLTVGLSEKLHHSKNYESEDIGLPSKYSVYNNKKESYSFKKANLTASNIITTTQERLDNYDIIRYIKIISASDNISAYLYNDISSPISILKNQSNSNSFLKDQVTTQNIHSAMSNFRDKMASEISNAHHKINHTSLIYENLLDQLKAKAIESDANAVIGITFQLTPIYSELRENLIDHYKVIATGNTVWAKEK